ncbi:MAG: PAS domain S-box protein, partial [Bacteroidota bacterium]
MENELKILIIDDSEDDVLLMLRELRKNGLKFEHKLICSAEELKTELETNKWHIVLCDYHMPGFSGLDALRLFKETGLDIPFIIISGAVGEQIAVDAMREGAHDYLLKDNLIRLVPAIERELKDADNRRRRRKADEEIQQLNRELENRVEERTIELTTINEQLINEIREREKTECELRQTKNFMNTILENIPNMIYVKDAQTLKYTFINRAGEKMTGLRCDYLLGRTVHEIFPPELADTFHNEDLAVLNNGGMLEIKEDSLVIGENSEKYFSTRKLVIRDNKGKPRYIMGISQDQTKQKEIRKDLEESKIKFSKVFHASPIAMCMQHFDDQLIVDINQSYLDLIGYTREEVLFKNMGKSGLWADIKLRDNIYTKFYRDKRITGEEVKLISKEGKEITVMLSLEHMKIGNRDFILCMGMDISTIKKSHEESIRALEKQKELNMLKTQFISMISHEFRTPLTTIMLSADLLRRYKDRWPEEEKEKHFQRIQDTVHKMTRLMENVLIIGKMDTGKFMFKPYQMNVQAFCKSTVDNILFNAGNSHRINFSFKGKTDYAYIDENLTALIISNLLTNAIKYSPKGSEIDLEVAGNGETVEFSITDRGCGIPDDEQHHLFQSFFRASNIGSVSGYGLGLAIVKKCV